MELRRDIWRHLTQAALTEEDLTLEASHLLQMSPTEVRTLAQLHLVLSEEVAELLEQMPRLIRRLSTTTVNEREVSAERLRGSIRWAETFPMRAATGLPHLFVTSPTRRAYETPENELLAFALSVITRFGRLTGWEDSTSKGVGEQIRDRITEAARWSRARALSDLDVRPPTAKTVARVRAGRRRELYAAALAVIHLYQEMIARLNRDAIRKAVEEHALATREDPVLLELLCAFEIMGELAEQGWSGHQSGLVGGGLIYSARRRAKRLRLFYQHTPPALSRNSIYRQVQADHNFSGAGRLRPDLVMEIAEDNQPTQWILLEIKGIERSVADSARAAALDLFGYRRAFDPVLARQAGPYGIGVAWGAELEPNATPGEIALCSPDTLPQALAAVLPV